MEYVILGHENPDIDSLISGYLLEKIMIKKGYNVNFIVPDENIDDEQLNLCYKYNLDVLRFKNDLKKYENCLYILVDHHDRNINGKIVAIIDHHPTLNLFNNLNFYLNEKASSTACLIAIGNEDLLDENDIKLACLATLVDTCSFNSTKVRDSDILWVKEMCNKYNFDYQELYESGLMYTDLSNFEKSIFNGLKKYKINNYKVESSYIQIKNVNENREVIKKMINKLKKYVNDNNIYLYIFIVYNMNDFTTRIYKIYHSELNIVDYSFYASRGNTIIPSVEEEFNNTI